eukprot:7219993-Alexandrium_andersonii.AAC.1
MDPWHDCSRRSPRCRGGWRGRGKGRSWHGWVWTCRDHHQGPAALQVDNVGAVLVREGLRGGEG